MKHILILTALSAAFNVAYSQGLALDPMQASKPMLPAVMPSTAPKPMSQPSQSVAAPIPAAVKQAPGMVKSEMAMPALTPLKTKAPETSKPVVMPPTPAPLAAKATEVHLPEASSSPVVQPFAVSTVVQKTEVVDGKAESVNPFTGKGLSGEKILKELELSKLRTQLLEEEYKQSNVRADLANVSVKKAVDAAQAETMLKKEEVAQKLLVEPAKPLVTAGNLPKATVTASPIKKVVKKPIAKLEPALEAAVKAVVPPPRPVLVLSSVLKIGQDYTAILSVDGNTFTAHQGESTPYGTVTILSKDSVNIGGALLSVHSQTLARLAMSDAVKESKLAGMGTSAATGVAPPTFVPQAPSAAITQTAPSLPPLQLPPGVKVFQNK